MDIKSLFIVNVKCAICGDETKMGLHTWINSIADHRFVHSICYDCSRKYIAAVRVSVDLDGTEVWKEVKHA